jgi:hypothetical protein
MCERQVKLVFLHLHNYCFQLFAMRYEYGPFDEVIRATGAGSRCQSRRAGSRGAGSRCQSQLLTLWIVGPHFGDRHLGKETLLQRIDWV